MYKLTFEEMMLFAKILAYISGDRSISLNQIDRDSAIAVLKRMADQRMDWNEQQKEQFKSMVDICKQYSCTNR